jgi:hypothetical protein
MYKTGEQRKVTPPLLDEDGNPSVGEDGANTKTSTAPTLEELVRRLEELTTENKKLRARAKNRRQRETPSQVKKKTPHLKRISPKGKRKEEEIVISLPITQYISIMIICLSLPLTHPYPLAKLSTLMELVITNESIA